MDEVGVCPDGEGEGGGGRGLPDERTHRRGIGHVAFRVPQLEPRFFKPRIGHTTHLWAPDIRSELQKSELGEKITFTRQIDDRMNKWRKSECQKFWTTREKAGF